MYVLRADSESFARGGSSLDRFFWCNFIFMKKSTQIALKAGHHRPASKMPFKWHFADRADDSQTLNAGLVAL